MTKGKNEAETRIEKLVAEIPPSARSKVFSAMCLSYLLKQPKVERSVQLDFIECMVLFIRANAAFEMFENLNSMLKEAESKGIEISRHNIMGVIRMILNETSHEAAIHSDRAMAFLDLFESLRSPSPAASPTEESRG